MPVIKVMSDTDVSFLMCKQCEQNMSQQSLESRKLEEPKRHVKLDWLNFTLEAVNEIAHDGVPLIKTKGSAKPFS